MFTLSPKRGTTRKQKLIKKGQWGSQVIGGCRCPTFSSCGVRSTVRTCLLATWVTMQNFVVLCQKIS